MIEHLTLFGSPGTHFYARKCMCHVVSWAELSRHKEVCPGTSLFSASDSHWLFPGTSSIDTTCTIWGLETGQVLGRVNLVSGHVKTQLIAHDKEVIMLFCSSSAFLSCLLCLHCEVRLSSHCFANDVENHNADVVSELKIVMCQNSGK